MAAGWHIGSVGGVVEHEQPRAAIWSPAPDGLHISGELWHGWGRTPARGSAALISSLCAVSSRRVQQAFYQQIAPLAEQAARTAILEQIAGGPGAGARSVTARPGSEQTVSGTGSSAARRPR